MKIVGFWRFKMRIGLMFLFSFYDGWVLAVLP
jgi:hypothetical protein